LVTSNLEKLIEIDSLNRSNSKSWSV